MKVAEKNNSLPFFKVQYHSVGDGNGYMSKVFKVDIHFDDDNELFTVALKVPINEGIWEVDGSGRRAKGETSKVTEQLDSLAAHCQSVLGCKV